MKLKSFTEFINENSNNSADVDAFKGAAIDIFPDLKNKKIDWKAWHKEWKRASGEYDNVEDYLNIFQDKNLHNPFINEKQTNPELVKKMAKAVEEEGDTCQRCGKPEGVCICSERDYGSTVNLNRLGKGTKVKNDSDFKKASEQ